MQRGEDPLAGVRKSTLGFRIVDSSSREVEHSHVYMHCIAKTLLTELHLAIPGDASPLSVRRRFRGRTGEDTRDRRIRLDGVGPAPGEVRGPGRAGGCSRDGGSARGGAFRIPALGTAHGPSLNPDSLGKQVLG